MDDQLVSADSSDDKGGDGDSRLPSFSTYTEKLEYYCSYYMSIGMSYDDYWDGDSDLCKYYRQAEERRIDSMNFNSWLQGLYFYEALLDSAPALNGMAKKHKPHPYRKKPIELNLSFNRKKETKREREKKQMKQGFEMMESIMETWNKQFRKKGGEDNV